MAEDRSTADSDGDPQEFQLEPAIYFAFEVDADVFERDLTGSEERIATRMSQYVRQRLRDLAPTVPIDDSGLLVEVELERGSLRVIARLTHKGLAAALLALAGCSAPGGELPSGHPMQTPKPFVATVDQLLTPTNEVVREEFGGKVHAVIDEARHYGPLARLDEAIRRFDAGDVPRDETVQLLRQIFEEVDRSPHRPELVRAVSAYCARRLSDRGFINVVRAVNMPVMIELTLRRPPGQDQAITDREISELMRDLERVLQEQRVEAPDENITRMIVDFVMPQSTSKSAKESIKVGLDVFIWFGGALQASGYALAAVSFVVGYCLKAAKKVEGAGDRRIMIEVKLVPSPETQAATRAQFLQAAEQRNADRVQNAAAGSGAPMSRSPFAGRSRRRR